MGKNTCRVTKEYLNALLFLSISLFKNVLSVGHFSPKNWPRGEISLDGNDIILAYSLVLHSFFTFLGSSDRSSPELPCHAFDSTFVLY